MPILEEPPRDEKLYRLRHSLAHVLAQAVQALHPGTRLGFGPPIDDGFYYDFLLPRPIGDEDLPPIEEKMREILRSKQAFRCEELPAEEALARIEGQMQEPHKLEYARELLEMQGLKTLTFYSNGPFLDMCEGPHVDNTSELPADGFRLYSTAAAYWRGDEKNVSLTRIYAYAYPTKKELLARIAAVEAAKKNDHRKLGSQLKIFVLRDEVGRGLPLWLPNGAVLRDELEKLAREMEFKYGYVRVSTPHITKRELYETSGHIPLYEDTMYPPMEVVDDRPGHAGGQIRERYYLKPMNCPHHHLIYSSEPRSYRDLPLRLAEYGTVYRFERGGQLQGLTRVRGLGMNDAHIYVTPEQLRDEFQAVMRLHQEYYDLFGFRDYFLRLSSWDPDDPKRKAKYVDDPPAWAETERLVREALDDLGLFYKLSPGEAAFYGPKVDFQFRSVIEKEFTVSTNQLDFAQPKRFGLVYRDKDGSDKMPYCIHRAPLSTHERFVAFLLEHYGGAFPTWLAPVQVRVLPVGEKLLEYGKKVVQRLRAKFVRAELDDADATVGKKIREAATQKIPLVLVIGEREEQAGTVTVRRHGVQEQRTLALEAFVDEVCREIAERRHVKS